MTENEAIRILGDTTLCTPLGQAAFAGIESIKNLQKYQAIGTVEECREARERQRRKKPVKDEYNHDCCPNCGWIVYQEEYDGRYLPNCENCGQAIDWYA